MGTTKRNCDNCGNEYFADNRNLKRGWGLCCNKSCAAQKREKSRPDYDPETVARNNRIRNGTLGRAYFESLPKIYGSGRITGITSEGYRIMDGVAYDEWDSPVYKIDPSEDAYDHGQW